MILFFVLSVPRISLSCAASSSASTAVTTTTIAFTTSTTSSTTSSTSSTTTTTTAEGLTACPTGWTQFMSNCYYLSADTALEPDAQEACAQRGANLASIHSQAENDFIQMLAAGNFVWIGVVRTAPGVVAWKNLDGTPFNFMNFADGDDFMNLEDCVVFNWVGTAPGKWVTINCVSGDGVAPFHYICEKPLSSF